MKFLWDILGTLIHYFQIILNFLYVCQSISWLTFLLKLDKYRDISSSVWYIFLKFFGGISGMFLHLFQIMLNFMYVCQSVSLPTSLLILDKYKDIFLQFVGDISWMLVHWFIIILNFMYVCQSVWWLTSLL